MGKLIVVSGPNESGKSAFAESLMSRIPGQRYYIATMVPQTEENYRRIEQQLLTAVNLARLSEISLDEMIEILTLLYKEE